MASDRYAVLKIRDSDPEVFWIAFMTIEGRNGHFMTISGDLTESELRAELQKMGLPTAKTEALIQQGRQQPV
jgi:hypothetical protein